MTQTYRPAARLKEGDFIARADGSFQKITRLVQVIRPYKFAMVTLADGFEVGIPHTREVSWRSAAEQARIEVAEEAADA